MSTGLSETKSYPNARQILRKQLLTMQADMALLHQSSSEAYQSMKVRLMASWENWPAVKASYKEAIQQMPKALRRRDFIKKSVHDVEVCESEMQRFMAELRDLSMKDIKSGFDKRLKEIEARVHVLQGRFHTAVEDLDRVFEQPLVQKFMRGERVYSARNNIQWRRKIFHTLSGLIFCYLFIFSGLPKAFTHTIGWALVIFNVSVEVFRHLYPKVNEIACHFFAPIMRESEKTKITAGTFYVCTMWTIYFITPIEVAMTTLLFVAIGDTVAGVIGVYFGRIKLKEHVTLEGFLACAISCGLIAYVCAGYLYHSPISGMGLAVFSVVGGLIGAVAESSFKKLDDNLVMPVISATFLWVLLALFGIV